MAAHNDLVPLIGTIYDAALAPEKWPMFLSTFAHTFQSEQALMWAHDFSDNTSDVVGGSTELAYIHGIDDFFIHNYAQHFCQCNVWLENEHLHQEGTVVNSSELYSDVALRRSEWFGDWLRPQEMFYSFAAVVEKRNRRSFNVTALRSKGRGKYSAHEMLQLRTLMPHLQTAFTLHRKLHRAEALAQASAALLDRLPLGIVLLGEKGSMLYANSKAVDWARTTGLVNLQYGIQGDSLHASHHGDDLLLQDAMRRVVATGMGLPLQAGQAMRLRGLQHDLHLLVAPLPIEARPFGAAAAGVVFLSNPATSLNKLDDVLRLTYQLTQAEALLAQGLVNGLSVNEYATQQGLSVHTVRVQLKSITHKMGVRRQSDLVRTILNGPAMFRWGEVMAHA